LIPREIERLGDGNEKLKKIKKIDEKGCCIEREFECFGSLCRTDFVITKFRKLMLFPLFLIAKRREI
jgi:hypothetical protein